MNTRTVRLFELQYSFLNADTFESDGSPVKPYQIPALNEQMACVRLGAIYAEKMDRDNVVINISDIKCVK